MYTVTMANDPGDRQRLYAAATLGRPRNWRDRPEGAVAKVYRSDDGGSEWRSLMDDGLVESVEALAVDADGVRSTLARTAGKCSPAPPTATSGASSRTASRPSTASPRNAACSIETCRGTP